MNLLYAPTKFIARKPDELVIADEKSYRYMENGSEYQNNEDRVVTVDLQSFSELTYQLITSARKVSTKFGWEIEVTCNGTNFIRY